jgi:hypothetical protein
MKKRKKDLGWSWLMLIWRRFIFIAAFTSFVAALYALYPTGNEGLFMFLINGGVILSGIIFENRRLQCSWTEIGMNMCYSLILSVIMLLPGEEEVIYNHFNHLMLWQVMLVITFVTVSTFTHGRKTLIQLNEGITLLQSIAIL